ncbi:MAG: zinc-ribbon domain-containing protein [Clostridiales bacterium]|nr:zinc-ribbon domain-containing protein [Clostridiales bacterium]
MTKGKFGLSTAVIAAIAFAFAAFNQPLAVLLITGFALLAEKNEWLNRQALQALLLVVTYYLVDLVAGWLFGGLGRLFGLVRLYGMQGAMITINSVVGDILYLALIVFSVIAVIQLLRGEGANLPIISKMAGGDFFKKSGSIVEPEPVKEPMPYQAPEITPKPEAIPKPESGEGSMVPPEPAEQPASEPVQEPIEQPTPEPKVQIEKPPRKRFCVSCGNSLNPDAKFCTNCGARNE